MLAGLPILLYLRRWAGAGAVAGGVAALTGAAFLVSPASEARPGPAIRIVQPNIGQQDKWRPGFERENLRRLMRLSNWRQDEPRLLLWPEAAVTRPLENGLRDYDHILEAAELRRDVAAMLGEKDLLLTGGVTWRSPEGLDVTSATNSVRDRSGRRILPVRQGASVPSVNICRCGRSRTARPVRLGQARGFRPGPGPAS